MNTMNDLAGKLTKKKAEEEKKKQEENKADILKRLVEQGVDLEYFGLYEPSLNDIFVEKAGDE